MEQEKVEKMVSLIHKQLELENDFTKLFLEEALAAIEKFDKKHTEKGLGKYSRFGAVGVVLEMEDIYPKIVEHYDPKTETKLNKDELLTMWQDNAIYSLMGKLIENDEWK